jgi:hypothetical protein
MRKGLLVLVSLCLAGTAPALAQMPSSSGYPLAYPGYGNPYGSRAFVPPALPPEGPQVLPPPLPPGMFVPGAGHASTATIDTPRMLGWPPPRQILPPSNPPPPELTPDGPCGPSACAPLTEPAAASPPPPVPLPVPAPTAPPELPHAAPNGYRWYGGAELLALWLKQGTSPPLAATGPLGAPGTTVLLDGPSFGNGERFGARGTLGMWLNPDQHAGIELTYLQLLQGSPSCGTGPQAGALAVPFFNVATAAEDAFVLASPGTQTGATEVNEVSRLWSAEGNFRYGLCHGCSYQLDLLAGVRAVGFDESLTQTSTTTTLAGPAAGTSLATGDDFGTHNLFLGGQLGMEAEAHAGRWSLDGWAKAALGNNWETANISGGTLVTSAGGAATLLPGGLFALPTNIGHYTHDQLAFVPEAGIHVGYQLAHHLRAFAGYDFLYLNNGVRPGDQMDRGVNPTQVVTPAGVIPGLTGPARPAFTFNQSDVWAQGVTLGLEFRY